VSRFPLVFLDEPLGNRVSQTALRLFNQCERSGYLALKYRRVEAQTVEMVRGSCVHAIKERAIKAMLAAGERSMPPELVKAEAQAAFEEFPVPVEEHDLIREEAHRWAGEFQLFQDERVVAVETLFVLEVADWTVRCKVDFGTVRQSDDGPVIHVEDWKSGRGVLPFDAVSRKRKDGTLAARNFQLILYILAMVFGRPVTVELVECTECDGAPDAPVCSTCDGSRLMRVERVGEQVARGCQKAEAEFVYPGVENAQGLMMRRPVDLTRLEMLEYLESLEALVKRLAHAEQSGEWDAVSSEKACDECPARRECPIPATLRDFLGEINTPEQAAEALQKRLVERKRDGALGREIRAFVKAQPGSRVVYGDRVAEIVPTRKEEIRDKDGFYAALAEGTPLEEAREKFVRVVEGTTFNDRELSEDELAERAA
jgi:hypothetical protein